MSYPIENIIEKAIENQVSSLLGNNDTNLQTIMKMALMDEVNQIDKGEMTDVLAKIRTSNEMEHYWIEKEYKLTYIDGVVSDLPTQIQGGLVADSLSCNNIRTYGKTQKDSSGVVLGSETSVPEFE